MPMWALKVQFLPFVGTHKDVPPRVFKQEASMLTPELEAAGPPENVRKSTTELAT